jgi:putative lipoic acid-binding regulatory protein
MSYLEKFAKQKELLDKEYTWPADYMFKFIVPINKEAEVRALFPNHNPTTRASKLGNYISLTLTYRAESSDIVLAIYEKASQIEGLIAL